MVKNILLFSTLMMFVWGSVVFGEGQTQSQKKIDYVAKVNELCRAGRDESLNAFPYYEKAAGLSVAWNSKTDRMEANEGELEKFVSSNKQALEQMEIGIQKPYCWTKYEANSLWDIKAEYLPGVKNITFAIGARAILNAKKGDIEKAYSDIILCYKFGQHWMGPRMLLEQVVGMAVNAYSARIGFHVLKEIASQQDCLEGTKKEVWLLKMKEFKNKFEGLVKQYKFIDYQAERYFTSEVIQAISQDLDDYNNVIPFPKLETVIDSQNFMMKLTTYTKEEFKKESKSWSGRLNKRECFKFIDEVYQYLESVNNQTPWQLHNEDKDVVKILEQMRKDNPFLGIFVPNGDRLYFMCWAGKADVDALLVTTAILCFKIEHNQYPENLEGLAAGGYLSKLPDDPFSGKPFVYRKTDDSFILYSVGIDFEDNNGIGGGWFEKDKKCDRVFWPVQDLKK